MPLDAALSGRGATVRYGAGRARQGRPQPFPSLPFPPQEIPQIKVESAMITPTGSRRSAPQLSILTLSPLLLFISPKVPFFRGIKMEIRGKVDGGRPNGPLPLFCSPPVPNCYVGKESVRQWAAPTGGRAGRGGDLKGVGGAGCGGGCGGARGPSRAIHKIKNTSRREPRGGGGAALCRFTTHPHLASLGLSAAARHAGPRCGGKNQTKGDHRPQAQPPSLTPRPHRTRPHYATPPRGALSRWPGHLC